MLINICVLPNFITQFFAQTYPWDMWHFATLFLVFQLLWIWVLLLGKGWISGAEGASTSLGFWILRPIFPQLAGNLIYQNCIICKIIPWHISTHVSFRDWLMDWKIQIPPPLHWLEAVMNILDLHKFEYIQTRTGWMGINCRQWYRDTKIPSLQLKFSWFHPLARGILLTYPLVPPLQPIIQGEYFVDRIDISVNMMEAGQARSWTKGTILESPW